MSKTPNNRIESVAIVGAGGRIGKAFAEALLGTGKHTVTGLSRADSKSVLPAGVRRVPVDLSDEDAVAAALQGQQFLVITLAVTAPPGTHDLIVRAAGRAKVPYIMPCIFGNDYQHPGLQADDMISARKAPEVTSIAAAGATSIVLTGGFWYQWSLACGEPWFGFDVRARTATFFDDGDTPITSCTWPQSGRALAALLSLPETGASPCVADWADKQLFFKSFRVTQRDMLASLKRVTGTGDADWTVRYEPAAERCAAGKLQLQDGDIRGYAKAMYSRTFYKDGAGDLEGRGRPLANAALGLPDEDVDAATRDVVQMIADGFDPSKEIDMRQPPK